MVKTVAIVQARTGSTRLPGKVLKKLGERTVLGHVIERLKAVGSIHEIWVATTTLDQDDAIVHEAEQYRIQVYRGSEQDVLDRYYRTAVEAGAETVVRITSDCPFIDPEITDHLIRFYHESACDYASNTLERTFPRGLDAEVFRIEALQEAWRNANQPFEREHVTPYIYLHPEKFSLASFVAEKNFSHYRWTLDTEEDWLLIQTIYKRLKHNHVCVTYSEIKRLMKQDPSLHLINAHVEQKKLGE
ncbi:spore coat polysaccharide biosynthesis protein F, CMP-KDO synthetase [Thermobacillus composti KWC4]|uniref:Spore coat polysaccharide biosynthesis protein F, CMP-KDO synthetase n=1 Tax=Thermobacillus composti (strain DSM 18247 / JCM 13945 / KWC4) TaxID=717605 RepID=L0E7Z9_THECK|nr:glycosyltransferase family protein [Thermobacillus composti]AGA56413.1 spore coat polysaccharide biosynthesis protein F, CMP-KDO synthetase [Thermobacillus composti KWC4]